MYFTYIYFDLGFFPWYVLGLIVVVVSMIMQSIDTSVIYHVVRVQSVIKLYVVYNMLDVRIFGENNSSLNYNLVKAF